MRFSVTKPSSRTHILKHFCYVAIVLVVMMPEFSCSAKVPKKFVAAKSSSTEEPDNGTRTFITDFISLHTLKMIGLLVLPFLLLFPFLVSAGIFLLFLPIPIISSPITGIAAAVGRRYNSQDGIDVLIQELFDSSDCIERISCEIGRSISSLEIRTIIDQALNDLVPYMKSKWKGMINGYIRGSNGRGNSHNVCAKHTCNIVNAAPADDWTF